MNQPHQLPGLPAGAADPCVHCGFCLPTCASYRVLASEMDSPRGRIHALRAIEAGELELDATVASHFDTCLGCYACVSACPSGVRYDQLIEATRPKLNQAAPQQLADQLPPAVAAGAALPQAPAGPAATVAGLCRHTAATAGPSLRTHPAVRVRRLRRWSNCCQRWLPKASATPCQRSIRRRVNAAAAWPCCWAACSAASIPSVSTATVKVLQANGFEVVIPPDQGCCGAVSHHQGELELTRQLATIW